MTADTALTPHSLCDSCQYAGCGCDAYAQDPNRSRQHCRDYRFWTRCALRAAQRNAAARLHSDPADWAHLCRLIEMEARLCP